MRANDNMMQSATITKIATVDNKQKLHKLNIEDIRNMQKLVIPAALGMSPLPHMKGRAEASTQLIERYWRATKLTYAKIRKMILSSHKQVRQMVDAIELQPGNEIFKEWHQSRWYVGFNDSREFRDIIMGAFSAFCEFNCDIRDVGKLNQDDMQVEDKAWAKANEVLKERLNNKLESFSLKNIAALNYEPVGKYPLAAYVRAFGLGIGLLPATNSLSRVDWIFTTVQPNQKHIQVMYKFIVDFQQPLISICTNILVMFGFFHLSKGHTFMPYNNDMNRIGTSYIRTLGTEVSLDCINSMLAHKETVVRIGPHPFGLAQTYWIARVMGHHGLLTPALALSLDATPPSVQQLMITAATICECANLPASLAIDNFVCDDYDAMQEQINHIKENAPAYSSLHRLYGIPKQSFINIKFATHVDVIMATIYKCIMDVHRNEGERNGMGLAQCLGNIERNKRGVINKLMTVWSR